MTSHESPQKRAYSPAGLHIYSLLQDKFAAERLRNMKSLIQYSSQANIAKSNL